MSTIECSPPGRRGPRDTNPLGSRSLFTVPGFDAIGHRSQKAVIRVPVGRKRLRKEWASRFLEECDVQLAAEYPMERVVGSTITFVLKVK